MGFNLKSGQFNENNLITIEETTLIETFFFNNNEISLIKKYYTAIESKVKSNKNRLNIVTTKKKFNINK